MLTCCQLSEAKRELSEAVAPDSQWLWSAVMEDGMVRWISKKLHAYITRNPDGGFDVSKFREADNTSYRQVWRSVPVLAYALALGEFA